MPTGTLREFMAALDSEIGYTECPRDARGRCLFTGHTGPGANHTKFAAEAGHPNGSYWCCTGEVAVFKRCAVSLPPGANTASTRTNSAAFKRARQWIEPADIRAGDVIYYHLTGRNGPWPTPDHTGIATGRPKNGRVPAIEFNTSPDDHGSQDNGGGVFRKNRRIAGVVIGAGRPNYTAAAAPVSAETLSLDLSEISMLPRCVQYKGGVFLVGYDPAEFAVFGADDKPLVVDGRQVVSVGPWRKTFPNVDRLAQVVEGGAAVTDMSKATKERPWGEAFKVTMPLFEKVFSHRGVA